LWLANVIHYQGHLLLQAERNAGQEQDCKGQSNVAATLLDV
jgi:hypothetical protein